MANLLRDIRFAISTLLRSPGTTTAIIVILALGIGANSAIFSLLNAVVLVASACASSGAIGWSIHNRRR